MGAAPSRRGRPIRPMTSKPPPVTSATPTGHCSSGPGDAGAGRWGTWLVRQDADPWPPAPPPAGTALTPVLPELPLPAVLAAAAHSPGPLGLVVRPVVRGGRYALDALCADGQVLAAVARTRIRQTPGYPPEQSVGPVPGPISAVLDRVVAALGWSQLLTLHAVWDPVTGTVTVTGLQAGASRSIGIADQVGVPLLAAAIQLARTGRAPVLPTPGPAVRVSQYLRGQVLPA